MELRSLGTTGLHVSALSYGASPLGSVFRDIDKGEGIRTVHEALDGGINFIDVSPYYGHTKAEAVLGEALRGIQRDKYILATKVGRYGEDEFDFSPARVATSLNESLARLGVDYVDIVQCHDIEFVDLGPIIHDTLPALRRLQEAGKARFVGVTGLPLRSLRAVAEHAPLDTVLSYCNYSLNNTLLQSDLSFFAGHGVGVINASPLSMGLLSRRGAPEWHPAPTKIKAACARAVAFCNEHGVDIAELAVQFALAEPGIATTLVGTASPENIRKNIAWASQKPDAALLHEVMQILQPVQNQLWPSGKPENN
jgi:L-galactose dehydrogenase